MNQDLISKKDLLELTGISYGQLYRWKRKNLIPEDWFIRKSTYTGQETFFPKEKILNRIEKIQTMKETLSLDELADMFSPNTAELSMTKDELLNRGIISESVLKIYLEFSQHASNQFSYQKILYVYILENLLQSGEINLEEGKMVLQVLEEYQALLKNSQLIIVRKLGISTCLLGTNNAEFHFEKGTKVVIQQNISSFMEELKTKLIY